MGFRFYKSNETNMKINGKQIHFGSYRLNNQVGRGKGIQNQYCSSYIHISISVYSDHIWMSIHHSYRSGNTFHQ
jgi:hypothetical protein